MPAGPSYSDLASSAAVVALPMRMRFRGITVREVMIFRGPAGWGEFGAFQEYDDVEASAWLAAGIEAAYEGPPPAVRAAVPVNATIPPIPADQVADVVARFPGAHTAKVKVAQEGQTLADDVARVEAVREHITNVRVDANGKWTVQQAITALRALGELEYAEQPCATIEELAQVRRATTTPIAADESIRRVADPLRVIAAGAADVAVLKVAPLGGMRRVLQLASDIPIPVVISSALDSAVGISAGVAAAAALPDLELACGLGTGGLFTTDVAEPFVPDGGLLTPRTVDVDVAALPRADAARTRWWLDRLRRCHALLNG
ncbi:o-succinylbenzoate synthase [Williamsia sp. 1135]|uniref:o-succinylbenzoate synthase n=1 Tax=Williamsia sp. 1135 TaxID=1889262 RepID=UPI000A1019E3|nr:o-succinylbenzoate synthase [Williamsia sp. 1135]ORM24974.1 O-succinylbenzoate synthase [Williamsia sp. 1135]